MNGASALMLPPCRRRPYYAAGQALVRLYLRLFIGCRVEGIEHLPARGGFLLAANHKSYLDPPLAGGFVPRELRYFAKRQLFAVPVFGRLIRAYGAIPVDREGADRRAIADALALLARGEGLLVFPEGTRIRRRGFGEPKAGIGLLALRSGVPVVPCFIEASWEPRRSWRRRMPARVRYGPPFHPRDPGRGAGRDRYVEAARAIMASIAALAPPGALDPGVSAPPPFENPD